MLKEKISNEDRYDIIKAEQQLTFATVVNPGEVTLYEHKDCEIIEKDPFSKYVVDVADGALLVEFDGKQYWCGGKVSGFVLNEPDGDYNCKLLGNVAYEADIKDYGKQQGQGAIYSVKKVPKNFGEIINTDLEKEYWKMIAALHARFVTGNNFDLIPSADIEFAASIISEEPTYTLLDVVNLFKFIVSNLGMMGENIPGRAFNNTLLNRFRTFYNIEKSKALEELRTKEKKDKEAIAKEALKAMPKTIVLLSDNMNVAPKTWIQKELARKGALLEEGYARMSPERRAQEMKKLEEKRQKNYKDYWDNVKAQEAKKDSKKQVPPGAETEKQKHTKNTTQKKK